MISTFILIAVLLFNTLESIATPCSVNAFGGDRRPPMTGWNIPYPFELDIFIGCESKHKIAREAFRVPLNSLKQSFQIHLIQFC
jgi:hypothetical protein